MTANPMQLAQYPEIYRTIREKYPDLRKSEARVADYISKYPFEVTNFSITELAKKCDTSESTVNRLCHSLGFEGYAVMKMSIARYLARDTVKTIPQDIWESDTINVVADKLKNHFYSAIEHSSELLNFPEIERARVAILGSKRIYFFGIGGSGNVARIAEQLFLKAGINAIAHDNGYMQSVTSSLTTERDLVVAITHSGKSSNVIKALKIAKEKGAKTMAITGNLEFKSRNHADIVLLTYSKEEPVYGDFLEAKISQLFILDLLYIGVLLQNTSMFSNYLETTARAISRPLEDV